MPGYRSDITSAHRWFTNTDQVFTFTVYETSATDAEIAAGTATPENITGWALSWKVKRHADKPDSSAVIAKATGGTGIAITDAVNGVCQVTVSDDDTEALAGAIYAHELKRTDAGSERVLTWGDANLQKALHKTT